MTKENNPKEWIANNGGPGFQAVGVIVKGPEIDGFVVLVESSALEAEREKVRKLVEALKEIYRLDDEGDMYRTPFQNIAWKALEEIEEA